MSGAQSGRADENETLIRRVGQRVGECSQFCSRCERNHAHQIEVGRVVGRDLGREQRRGPALRVARNNDSTDASDVGERGGSTDTVEHGMPLRDAGERGHARRSYSFVVRGNEDRAAFNLLTTKRRQVVANLMRRRTLVAEPNRAVRPREHSPLALRSRGRYYRETRHCDVAALFAARVIEHPPNRRRRIECREAQPSQPRSACRARRPAEDQVDGTGHRAVMGESSQPARSKPTTQCAWKSCATRRGSARGTPKPRTRFSQRRCTGRAHRRLLGQSRLEPGSSRPRPETHLHPKSRTVAASGDADSEHPLSTTQLTPERAPTVVTWREAHVGLSRVGESRTDHTSKSTRSQPTRNRLQVPPSCRTPIRSSSSS